jgi:hypothetical protein
MGFRWPRNQVRNRLSPGGRWIRTSSTAAQKLASCPFEAVVHRNRKFADSPLEGDGFEPSVPRQVFLAAPSIPAQFTFRNINRLARDRDRWFESISLHRRISCEPEEGLVWLSAQIIAPLWRRLDSNGPRRYRRCLAEIPRDSAGGRPRSGFHRSHLVRPPQGS